MSKPVYHVAVALVQRDARWLVARRHADAHLGGFWEFPGGKCADGEAPSAGALRELREECGVIAAVEHTLKPVYQEYSDRSVNITPVLCRWRAGEAQPLGCADCRWVTFAELRQLNMPPANVGIINQIEPAT